MLPDAFFPPRPPPFPLSMVGRGCAVSFCDSPKSGTLSSPPSRRLPPLRFRMHLGAPGYAPPPFINGRPDLLPVHVGGADSRILSPAIVWTHRLRNQSVAFASEPSALLFAPLSLATRPPMPLPTVPPQPRPPTHLTSRGKSACPPQNWIFLFPPRHLLPVSDGSRPNQLYRTQSFRTPH